MSVRLANLWVFDPVSGWAQRDSDKSTPYESIDEALKALAERRGWRVKSNYVRARVGAAVIMLVEFKTAAQDNPAYNQAVHKAEMTFIEEE